MDWLQTFSDHYANGITAVAALAALGLAAATLWYLQREYASKHRPYVFPAVLLEPFPNGLGCVVGIAPQNVGSHPCLIKLGSIRLHVGDETYETPDTKDWILLGS